MSKKMKYDNKEFGKLLKVGDKVRLTNLWNTELKPVECIIISFNGCEYVTGADLYENIGHSGFIVESPEVFYVCMNKTPYCKVEKINEGGKL